MPHVQLATCAIAAAARGHTRRNALPTYVHIELSFLSIYCLPLRPFRCIAWYNDREASLPLVRFAREFSSLVTLALDAFNSIVELKAVGYPRESHQGVLSRAVPDPPAFASGAHRSVRYEEP